MLKRLLVIWLFLVMILPASFAIDNINFTESNIYDGAGIIRYNDKKLLDLYIKDLRSKTPSEMVVVTLPTLKHQNAQGRAMHINKAFRVGGASKDSGIVLLVSPDGNEVAIHTGYFISDAIPDIRKKQIINDVIKENFSNKFYSKGIYDATVICIMDVAKYYNINVNGLEYVDNLPMPKTFIQKITPLEWIISILLLITGVILYILTKPIRVKCHMGFGGDFNNLDEW